MSVFYINTSVEIFWAILAKNRILLFAISGHTAVVPNSAQLFYTIKSDRKKVFLFCSIGPTQLVSFIIAYI